MTCISTDLPAFSEPEDLEAFIFKMTDEAIARYHEAVKLSEFAQQKGWGKWSVMAINLAMQAEESLLCLILARSEGFCESDVYKGPQKRWPTCGVRSEGRTYLAVPDENCDDADTGFWKMKLCIFDDQCIREL